MARRSEDSEDSTRKTAAARTEDDWASLGSDPDKAYPLFVFFGYLANVRKQDADGYVRGLIERICSDPQRCAYHLYRYGNGILYEIQEGGDKRALLPPMLDGLKAGRREFWVRTVDGIGRVRFLLGDDGLRDVDFNFGKEEDFRDEAPEREAFVSSSGHRLYPFHDYREKWVKTAVGFFAFGAVVFALGVYVKFAAYTKTMRAYLDAEEEKFVNLPIFHYPKVRKPGSYVHKLFYRNGKWSVEWKSVDENGIRIQAEQAEAERGSPPLPERTGTDGRFATSPRDQARQGGAVTGPAGS